MRKEAFIYLLFNRKKYLILLKNLGSKIKLIKKYLVFK